MDIADKTKALRTEAWEAVLATKEFKVFQSLDNAVTAMTGEVTTVVPIELPAPRFNASGAKPGPTKRITQGDIAARVLKANGEPLPVGRWLEKSVADGIGIKGDDPLSNFRSTVSRDKRFYSFKRNNMYFWWFDGVELPENWKEAADDLPFDTAASDSNNQEGGDGHAATMS